MTETINNQSITKSLKLLSDGFKNEFAMFVHVDERTSELLMELSTEFVNDCIPVVNEDHRDDVIVKGEIADEIEKEYNILGVFDDRKKVIDMWINRGIFVFDVGQGKGDF